jgi:hypothetical protein
MARPPVNVPLAQDFCVNDVSIWSAHFINPTWSQTMKAPIGKVLGCVFTGVALAAAAAANAQQNAKKSTAKRVPLEAATMIIEYNSSAKDIGIQFFLDSEGWREVEIFDPVGREIFSAETDGILTRQGGGTELFLESVEPTLTELPIEKFFKRFPEGVYRFRGTDNDGNRLVGQAQFSHDVPAGPQILMPKAAKGAECAKNVPARGTVVAWDPVTQSISGDPIEISGYEVIVENEDTGLNFDVKFPAETGTLLTLPLELLEPGTDYIGEVLAVETGGNQTISEFCFTTAG